MNKNKKTSRIIGTIISVVLTAIILIVLVFVFYSRITGRVPKFFGYSCLYIVSGSMEDTIETGSVIFVKEINPNELKVNDIISFYSSDPSIKGKPNTHRIVEITDQGYKTIGDANYGQVDKYPVSESDVIGVYKGTSKQLSFFVGLLRKPVVLMLIIVIPTVIFFIYELRNLIKRLKGAK